MSRSVVQVVRRFGCVGGMESYVWFLSHELARLDYQVVVVCEECEGQPDPAIELVFVPKSLQQRRWKAMREFNRRIDQVFQSRPGLLKSIIHSHERTAWHHVTTFHGPPMKKAAGLPWYKRYSPRVNYWLDVEDRELCGASVQKVVPVSEMIGKQLLDQYPGSRDRMMAPGRPGLSALIPKNFQECGQVIRLLFVGKEWERKGLRKAMKICEGLSRKYSVQFDVFGVGSADVPSQLNYPFVNFKGYQTYIPFEEYDLLIHPAVSEPFGMVVIEALSSGCRALVSDQVGAAESNHDGLTVMELDGSVSRWVDAAVESVSRVLCQWPRFETWADVAVYYDTEIYNDVSV